MKSQKKLYKWIFVCVLIWWHIFVFEVELEFIMCTICLESWVACTTWRIWHWYTSIFVVYFWVSSITTSISLAFFTIFLDRMVIESWFYKYIWQSKLNVNTIKGKENVTDFKRFPTNNQHSISSIRGYWVVSRKNWYSNRGRNL